MPELPEVQTIRDGLIRRIVGKAIKSVEVRVPKLFEGNLNDVIGMRVVAVSSRGKLLVIELSNNYVLTVHLKMTGQLVWQEASCEGESAENCATFIGGHPQKLYLETLPHKHTHIIFSFNDGSHLYFNDLRKFGRVTVMPKADLDLLSFIVRLGPEPLSSLFTLAYLERQLAKKSSSNIKTFLLDQSNIAGLGNIYADEALFEAEIMPDRKCGSITDDEKKKLHQAVISVLKKAIEHGGSTARDYINVEGQVGTFLNVANVYRRTGLPCKKCKGVVERMKIGGRSSHFCRICQK